MQRSGMPAAFLPRCCVPVARVSHRLKQTVPGIIVRLREAV